MTRNVATALSLLAWLGLLTWPVGPAAGQGTDPYYSSPATQGSFAPATPDGSRAQSPTSSSQGEGVDSAQFFVAAREFTLPIQVNDPTTLELRLFVSRNSGASWDFVSRHTPRESAIAFTAPVDGEYWFYLHAMTQANPSPIPADFPGAMKVVIDSQRPILDAIAYVAEGGGLGLRWAASDLNAEPSSLAVAFRPKIAHGPEAQWQSIVLPGPVGLEDPLNRSTVIWPNTDQRVLEVLFVVRDRAGNVSQVMREVQFPEVPIPPAGLALGSDPRSGTSAIQVGTSEPARPQNVPWSTNPAPNTNADSGVLGAEAPAPTRSAFVASADDRTSDWGTTVAPRDEHPETRAEQANRLPSYAMAPTSQAEIQALPAANRTSSTSTASADESNALEELPPPISSRSQPRFQGASGGEGEGAFDWSGLPESMAAQSEYSQMVSSTRFRLAYDVDSVGTQGIAKVQLWLTEDGGESWVAANEDPDCESPISVELPGEGVFGFHLVVTARNGLSGDPPRPGQSPDMWVVVDQSAPTVELVDALVGEGSDYGKLIIRWRALDPHLGNRPVSLRYSESANGPWNIVASGLPNTGEYAWTVVPSLPKHFFLRVEVEDRAGNVGADTSPLPVDLSSLVPRGTLRGFVDPGSREP